MCYPQLTLKYMLFVAVYFCQCEYSRWQFPASLWINSFYCNHRNFLNVRCTLETKSFENLFARHIALSPCSCCNMCNFSAGDVFKHYTKFDTYALFFQHRLCFRRTRTTTGHWHALSQKIPHCGHNSSSPNITSHVLVCHGKWVPCLPIRAGDINSVTELFYHSIKHTTRFEGMNPASWR